MLSLLENLPPGVLGVRADGVLSREDYETVLIPLLNEAHFHNETGGGKIGFVYQFAEDFTGLTPGAVWDDFRISLKFLRLFRRCAIVSGGKMIRGATQFFSSFVPCPTRVFESREIEKAISWAASIEGDSKRLFDLKDDGILIFSPSGPLKREDFDTLSEIVDEWTENHRKLTGLVVCAEKFPGWEDIGTFFHHLGFVKENHKRVRRVALAVNGSLPQFASKVAAHFVDAEIKQFPFYEKDEAIRWVRATEGKNQEEGSSRMTA